MRTKEMRIGIIQTRGIGDIVIAIPIANYYMKKGYEVYWPIDSDFYKPFKLAFPNINFISINSEIQKLTKEYFFEEPKIILEKINCSKIICLYSYLSNGYDFGQTELQKRLALSLSFDAYKYAIADVPFKEKWNFKPIRNYTNELLLSQKL